MEGLYPQFLLVGDSLIECTTNVLDGFSFAAALQTEYARRLDVVNRGFSGYNSTQVLEILPQVLKGLSPGPVRFMLILIGANDACLPGTTGQGVDLDSYKRNIEALITHQAVVALDPKIILVTPPPIDEVRWEERNGMSKASRKASVTAEYAAAARKIGANKGNNVAVVDLWSMIMNEAIRNTPGYTEDGELLGSKELGSNKALTDLMPDGLHLDGRGYKIFYEGVMDAIREHWPQETPQICPYIFPLWHDMLARKGF